MVYNILSALHIYLQEKNDEGALYCILKICSLIVQSYKHNQLKITTTLLRYNFKLSISYYNISILIVMTSTVSTVIISCTFTRVRVREGLGQIPCSFNIIFLT